MRSKLFGRLMSFTLSATVALTSGIPALAYDGGGGNLPEDDEEIQLLEEDEEIGSDFEAPEEIVEDEIFLDEEQQNEDFSFTEEDEAEFESYQDVTITFNEADDSEHAHFYVANGDSINVVAAYDSDEEVGDAHADDSEQVDINSDYGYSFYVAPQTGYELATMPVSVAGSFTAKTGATPTTFTTSELEITALSEGEKAIASSGQFSVAGNYDAGKDLWDSAVKVTIKGGAGSYLAKFIAAQKANETGFTLTTPISITLGDAVEKTYRIPIYKYDPDAAVGSQFTASNLPSGVTLTYGTLSDGAIDIYGALSAADWKIYTPKLFALKKNADGVKVIDTVVSPSESADWDTDKSDPDDVCYKFTTTSGKVYFNINAFGAQEAFIYPQTPAAVPIEGEYAILLVKTEAGVTHSITAKSTDYVTFCYGDAVGADDEEYDGKGIVPATGGITIYDQAHTLGSGNDAYYAVVTPNAAGSSYPRKIVLYYQYEGMEKALIVPMGSGAAAHTGTIPATVPANTENLVITAKTYEGVEISGDHITATYVDADGNEASVPYIGTAYDYPTGESLVFKVNSTAGYEVSSVKYTQYKVDGTAATTVNSVLRPNAEGFYTIPKISGYTEITAETTALTNLLSVKAGSENASAVSGSFATATVTDYRTGGAITSTAAAYAPASSEYKFRVKAAAGWKLAATGAVTAKVGDTAISVSATGTSGVYSLTAPAEGVVEISVSTVKVVDVVKVENKYATVLLNGTAIADKATVQFAADEKIKIEATGANGAEVKKIFYAANGAETDPGDADLSEVTKNSDGEYIIPASVMNTWRNGHDSMFIYVSTERKAVKGTDFTVKFTNADLEDVSAGIDLYADGSDSTVNDINPNEKAIITATFKIGKVTQNAASYTTASQKAHDDDVDAGVPLKDQTKVIAAIVSTNMVNPENKYSGKTAEQVTDTLIATYKTSDVFNVVAYEATAPINEYPLRSYYKKDNEKIELQITGNTASADGVPEDSIRDNSSDAVTLAPGYVDKDATFGAITVGDDEVSSILWKVTPEESALTGYTLDPANAESTSSDTLIIEDAIKSPQALTAKATITFVDGTTAELTKNVNVIATDIGYFAIPTTTINGVKTLNAGGVNPQSQTITLELDKAGKTSINSATIGYDIYHVIDLSAAGYLSDSHTLDSAADIKAAINAGEIEKVDPSNVTWTALVGTNPKFADYYTVSGSAGVYTITAKAITGSDNLLLKAKVGDYEVTTPTVIDVVVNRQIPRKTVTFAATVNNAGDLGLEFTDAYISSLGYRVEEELNSGEIKAYHLTDVATGTSLTLPDESAFKAATVPTGMALAGWKVGASEYVKANGEGVTSAINTNTTITPIWMPKFANIYGGLTASGELSTSSNSANLGKVIAFNSASKKALSGSFDVAIGANVPITIAYYAIDTSKAPTSTTSAYYASAKDITIVDPSTVASSLKITSTSTDASKFETTSTIENATTVYTFKNNTLTPKTEATTIPVVVEGKWTISDKESYTLTPMSVGIKAAKTYEFAMDPVSIEVGQTVELAFDTFTADEADVVISNTAAIATYKFEPADKTIATIKAASGDNTFKFKGEKTGSTTATLTFTDVYGTSKSYSVPVTVKPAKYSIVAKVAPDFGSYAINEIKEITLGASDTAYIPVATGGKFTLSMTNQDDFAGTITYSVAAVYPTLKDGTTPNDDIKATIPEGNITRTSGTNIWTVVPTTMGISTLKVTALFTPTTGDPFTYEREIPINSYGTVKVMGPVTGHDCDPSGATLHDEDAFKVYTDSGKKTEVVADKYAVIPVYFEVVKATEEDEEDTYKGTYTVSDISAFTATWKAASLYEFLGWGSTATMGETAANLAGLGKDYTLAGGSITITKSQAQTGHSVYAWFKGTDLTLHGGYNNEINLSDEVTTAPVAASDPALTTEDKVSVRITPVDSTSRISVYANRIGIINIVQYTDDNTIDTNPTTEGIQGDADSDPDRILWDGATKLAIEPHARYKDELGGSSPTDVYRIDEFAVEKIGGEVGVVKLYIDANGEEADVITVYANGEYVGTDGETYYMYRGENLKNESAIVDGETHYYDEDGVLITDGPFFVEDDQKWVLISDGAQVKTLGITIVDGKKYYVGKDGFVKTGLFDGLITSGTKKDSDRTYYADPKDPSLVVSKIVDVDGKKLYFDKNAYQAKASATADKFEKVENVYVDAEGNVAIAGIFTVAGVDRLFRTDATIVSYTDKDVVDGKIEVDGTAYVIDKDTNEAKADHKHKWTATWAKWTVKDTATKVTLKCSVGNEEVTKDVPIVASEPNKAGIITYTASITYAGETFTDTAKVAKIGETSDEIIEVIDISDGYGFYIDGLEEEYPYTGAAIKPSFAVIDAERGVYLAKGVDFTVSIKKNKKIGDVADVVVKGKGNYKDAAVTAHFTVVDPMKGVDQDDVELLKGAKIQFTTKSYVYTGKEILPTDIQLKLKGQSAFTTYEFNGTTYVDKEGNEIPGIWSVSNNVDKGTATLLLSGKTGSSAKATYKITAASFNETDFELTVDPTETEWAVKGAQPSVEVTWKGTPLIAGQDFKVTYDKANKAVGTATVTVSGKGNFTAKPALSKSFTVTALDLSNAEIVASTAAAKVNAKSVKVTVLDANGDAIPAGKLAVTVYKDGSAVTGKLAADTEYTIVATPKNEKVTVLTGATPEFSVKIGTDIKKAKVAAKVKGYTVTYTGDPIIYDDDSFGEAFTVTIGGKTLTAGTDFVVAGHTNNIKKGTMTVTLQGIGDYCGTKPVKVKIVPKKLKK